MQIKDQIKLAYCVGRLREGDILPSIRSFADQLGVGESIVRRAYQELTQSGFLSAEPRKHLMVSDTLDKPEHVETLARDWTNECERLVMWAREQHLSPISLARWFLRHASEEEQARPAYVYVDLGRDVAASLAETISTTWELPVASMTMEEIGKLSEEELDGFAGILVNYSRHEELLASIGDRTDAIFPIRTMLHNRTVRRIRRQAAGSTVLIVLPASDANRMIGTALIEHLEKEVGDNVHLEAAAVDDIADLAEEAASGRYRLVIVSRHIWDDIPEKARRCGNVIPHELEIAMDSLERARVAAGVFV